MYAVESSALWNKFIATVELLAVIKSTVFHADSYVNHCDLRWVGEDSLHYKEIMNTSTTLGRAAETAIEAAARNLLQKEAVDTAFLLAIESIETTIRGFNFLMEMQKELSGVTKDRKHLLAALEAAQPHR